MICGKSTAGITHKVVAWDNVLTHYATHTHDSRTFELNGEEKTHVLGRKSANMVNTDRGGYTLNEQMDRARGIWAVLSAPAWASIN